MRSEKYPDGVKFDKGKLRYDLIVPESLQQLAEVMTGGAEKYDDNSWQALFATDGKERYIAALMRHVESFRLGTVQDPETGLHPLAHAAANCFFLIWNDLQKEKTGQIEVTLKIKDEISDHLGAIEEMAKFDGALYIAGPMRGYPRYNFDMFGLVTRKLRLEAFKVVSPHEHDLEMGLDPDKKLTEAEETEFLKGAFSWDVQAIRLGKGIVLLPGWEKSGGARCEATIALFCGKEIWVWDPIMGQQLIRLANPAELDEIRRKPTPDQSTPIERTLARAKARREPSSDQAPDLLGLVHEQRTVSGTLEHRVVRPLNRPRLGEIRGIERDGPRYYPEPDMDKVERLKGGG